MYVAKALFALVLVSVLDSVIGAATKPIFRIKPEKTERILEELLKCVQKAGNDLTLLDQIKEGKYSDDNRAVEALLCSTVGLGYGTEDGRLNVDKLMSDLFLNKPEIRSAMEDCDKDFGKTPAENFKSFLVCFRDGLPVKIML